LIFYDSNKMA